MNTNSCTLHGRINYTIRSWTIIPSQNVFSLYTYCILLYIIWLRLQDRRASIPSWILGIRRTLVNGSMPPTLGFTLLQQPIHRQWPLTNADRPWPTVFRCYRGSSTLSIRDSLETMPFPLIFDEYEETVARSRSFEWIRRIDASTRWLRYAKVIYSDCY